MFTRLHAIACLMWFANMDGLGAGNSLARARANLKPPVQLIPSRLAGPDHVSKSQRVATAVPVGWNNGQALATAYAGGGVNPPVRRASVRANAITVRSCK